MEFKFEETTIEEGKIRLIAYYKDISIGGFEASVDREKYKSICVTDFDMEKNVEGRNSILEAFRYFSEKEKLPIFFRLHVVDSRGRFLREIGAKEFEDVDHITVWGNEPDNPDMFILKLEL